MRFWSQLAKWKKEFFAGDEYERENELGEDGFIAAGAMPAKALAPLDLVIFTPASYSDARWAVEALEKGKIIMIILSNNVDIETAGRFVDFMSGAIYFAHGEVELLNGEVLLCVPSSVRLERGAFLVTADIPVWRGER